MVHILMVNTMEGTEVELTETAVQHMKERQLKNMKHTGANLAQHSSVKYIFMDGSVPREQLKGKYRGRRTPHTKVYFATVVAVAASLSMLLVCSFLCRSLDNKRKAAGLVQRRLSHSDKGYTLANRKRSCAVLERDLKGLQSVLNTTEESYWREATLLPNVYGHTGRPAVGIPWVLQTSTGTSSLPVRGGGNTQESTLAVDLMGSPNSDIKREARGGVFLPTPQIEQPTTATTNGAKAILWSSAREPKKGANESLSIPSLGPLWTAQDDPAQGSPGEFDSMLFHSLSCERTEGTKKAALRGTTQARSQSLFGFQPSTIEQDDEAVLAGSTAASSGSLERDFVNQGEDLDCQAPAEDAGTGDSRSRKIAAIVKMLSSAAEEFEAGSKGAQGRLQQASCGPFTPKARTLERASLDRPAAESPASPSVDNRGVMESLSVQTLKTSHLANRIADPQSVDNGVAGDASKLSVPQSPNEKAQSNLLHHDVAYGVGPYGTPTIPFYSVVLREASEPVVQAPFAGSMLANLQLESTEDNFSRTNGVSKKSGCNGTQGNSNFGYVPSYMLQPVTSCQATTIKAGPSSVSVSVSKAPGNGAGTDIPTPTLAHPYVRLPFVPREAITRTFDFKCALSCGLHDRFVLTHLETMRTLFAKESLDWISVNKLLSTSQRLVNHAFFLLRLPQVPDIPSRVNRKLGLLFLTFDAVVCTIELLGESMLTGAWWRKFTGVFNTDYYLKATGTIVPAETGRAGFGNRLLSALRIYKTGRRPHAEEIISLKRLLFCSNVSPDIFQRRQWDQWRLDDKEWCGAKWTGV